MPSSPHSAHVDSTRAAMSRNTECAAAAGLLSNTRTVPKRSTTNQRLGSRGAWIISSGFLLPLVTGSLKEMFGNARCVLIVALPLARAGAIQVVLLGRASSPTVAGPGGFPGGCGG